jgi:polar amino acid transport system substrate-binding protein
LLTACASDNTTNAGGGGTPSAAASCDTANPPVKTAGELTIGTDNPAYPPYFAGGETKANPDWKFNDPYTGKGFEDALAYEIADRMGFSTDQVKWTVAPFGQLFKPGPTNFDFAIEQISYSPKRTEAVDLSDSYYDVTQALVAVKGTPIASATSVADLKPYKLASQIGTTGYDYIVNTIQPDQEAGAYDKLSDAVAAINAGQVDGLVVDYPTALYMADPFVQQVKNSVVVGQFQTTAQGEYFSIGLEKGSALTDCVNQVIGQLKSDGTLEQLQTTWLTEKTNVGKVPTLT